MAHFARSFIALGQPREQAGDFDEARSIFVVGPINREGAQGGT